MENEEPREELSKDVRAMECPHCKEIELIPQHGSRGEMWECMNCHLEVQF